MDFSLNTTRLLEGGDLMKNPLGLVLEWNGLLG